MFNCLGSRSVSWVLFMWGKLVQKHSQQRGQDIDNMTTTSRGVDTSYFIHNLMNSFSTQFFTVYTINYIYYLLPFHNFHTTYNNDFSYKKRNLY